MLFKRKSLESKSFFVEERAYANEIAFLEDSPASVTIVAEQESVVLAVSRRELEQRILEDVAFAARLYRAFALVAERRLRNRVDNLVFLFEFGSGWCGQSEAHETLYQI